MLQRHCATNMPCVGEKIVVIDGGSHSNIEDEVDLLSLGYSIM